MNIGQQIKELRARIKTILERLETSSSGSVSDTVYGASWNGVTTVAPSKNAVYDKIETIGGGTPGGSNTQVQFNDSSAFGGDAGMVYNKTTDILTLAGGVIVSAETASTIAQFDASKQIKSLAVATYPSLTELSYVKGVTSALQTQMDLKAPLASPTFTGVPAAPTAAQATDTTQIATTAFVQDAVSSANPNNVGSNLFLYYNIY